MELDIALKRLSELTGYIHITYGTHVYREGVPPHYDWEVIAASCATQCYAPFEQSNDLLAAVEYLVDLWEWKHAPDTIGIYPGPGWRK